jgi:hypothetical protein
MITQLSPGALAVLLPVFRVPLVEALTVLARVHLETNAVEVACSPPPRHGADGTDV